MNEIGEMIKKLRESRGMTQQQLADVVGAKTYTTITKWEKGENYPKGRDIAVLSRFFKISSDTLLGLKPPEPLIARESSYPYLTESISAGLPEVVEGVTETELVTLPDLIMGKYAGSKDIYVMRVNGESMNRVIPNGSLIAVKRMNIDNIKDGDIVVYGDRHEYSIKRLYRADDKMIFRPDSNDASFTDYVTSVDEHLEIVGKVVIYIVELV